MGSWPCSVCHSASCTEAVGATARHAVGWSGACGGSCCPCLAAVPHVVVPGASPAAHDCTSSSPWLGLLKRSMPMIRGPPPRPPAPLPPLPPPLGGFLLRYSACAVGEIRVWKLRGRWWCEVSARTTKGSAVRWVWLGWTPQVFSRQQCNSSRQ